MFFLYENCKQMFSISDNIYFSFLLYIIYHILKVVIDLIRL